MGFIFELVDFVLDKTVWLLSHIAKIRNFFFEMGFRFADFEKVRYFCSVIRTTIALR